MGWAIVESFRVSMRIARAGTLLLGVGLLAGCNDSAPAVGSADGLHMDRAAYDVASDGARDGRHARPPVYAEAGRNFVASGRAPILLETDGRPTPNRSALPGLPMREAPPPGVSPDARRPELAQPGISEPEVTLPDVSVPEREPEHQDEVQPDSQQPVESPVEPSFTVRIEPATLSLSALESRALFAALRDAKGRAFPSQGAIWWSSNRRVATVADGIVTAQSAGTATISVSIGGIQGDATITVSPVPLARLDVRSPIGSEIVVGSRVQLSTEARDATGRVLFDHGRASWTSDNPRVAHVDASGQLTANEPGTVLVTATVDGVSATLSIRSVLRFTQVAAGKQHTCAISTKGEAWCWGKGAHGQLGSGVGLTAAPTPVLVQGGFSFRSLTSRDSHTCALVDSQGGGNAVCWGMGAAGRLGTGGVSDEWVPARVANGIDFQSLTAGSGSTCGLTGGPGFCWGAENGSTSPDPVPAVQGFESLLLGPSQAAGILSGEVLHFPGKDASSTLSSTSPDPVPARDLIPGFEAKDLFLSYAVGDSHVCATLEAQDRSETWCWGDGTRGRLGNGTTASSPLEAVRIEGLPGLAGLVAGTAHTCGLTGLGEAWCWGDDTYGQLGANSTSSMSTVPLRVAGPRFVSLAAGTDHTCGISLAGEVWCWGRNTSYQLGDGSTNNSKVPVLVSLQH